MYTFFLEILNSEIWNNYFSFNSILIQNQRIQINNFNRSNAIIDDCRVGLLSGTNAIKSQQTHHITNSISVLQATPCFYTTRALRTLHDPNTKRHKHIHELGSTFGSNIATDERPSWGFMVTRRRYNTDEEVELNFWPVRHRAASSASVGFWFNFLDVVTNEKPK